MSYTTAGAIVQKNREEKKRKFDELLAKAMVDNKPSNFYYDPETGTHKRKLFFRTNTKGAKYA